MSPATPGQIDSYITRWENSGAAERANYQVFFSGLCDIIGVRVPIPLPPIPRKTSASSA